MSQDARSRAQYTLRKEIYALAALSQVLDDQFDEVVSFLLNRKGKIVVTGVGKSGFIGMKIAATLTSLGHFSTFLHPLDALHGDAGLVAPGDVVIALSFSGGTREVVSLVGHLKRAFGVPMVAITGSAQSPLANISDYKLVLSIEGEGCPLNLAPMASTVAMLCIGDALASAMTSPDTFGKESFARFHPGGSLGLSLMTVRERMVTDDSVPMILEEATLVDTLKEITKKRKGIVGVISKRGALCGVITDGDVRRFFIKNTTAKGVQARDAMTHKPKSVGEETSLLDALSLMEENEITNLFVVNSKKEPVGLIHIHDILRDSL